MPRSPRWPVDAPRQETAVTGALQRPAAGRKWQRLDDWRQNGAGPMDRPSLPSSGETVPAVGLLSPRARMERRDVGVDEVHVVASRVMSLHRYVIARSDPNPTRLRAWSCRRQLPRWWPKA